MKGALITALGTVVNKSVPFLVIMWQEERNFFQGYKLPR